MIEVESIDEIQTRSKRVISPYIPHIPPSQDQIPEYAKPQISTITPVEQANITTTKNVHIPPNDKKALGYHLAEAICANEKTISGIIELIQKNIKIENNTLQDLSEKDSKLLEELLKDLAKKNNIDVFRGILSCISSAAAITIGLAIIAPEAFGAALISTSLTELMLASDTAYVVCGYILVATGTINIIGNEVMPYVNGWEKIASFFTEDKNKQENLANTLQVTTSSINSILSITSTLATSSFLTPLLNSEIGLKIATLTTQIGASTLNFAKGMSESNIKDTESRQTLIQGEEKDHAQTFQKEVDNLEKTAKMSEVFTEAVKDAMSVINSMNKKLTS